MIEKTDRRKPWKVIINGKGPDGKRKRIHKAFATYAEAKEAEGVRLGIRNARRDTTGTAKISIELLVEGFCEKRKEEIRITSIDAYRRCFRLHVVPFFHGMDRRKCDKDTFQRWKGFVTSGGNILASRRNIYKRFHSLLSFAYKEYGLDALKYLDMAGTFKKDPNAIEKEEDLHFWNPYQFSAFISRFRKDCEKISPYSSNYMAWWGSYVRLNILFFAGLRKGEANALTPEDFFQRRGVYYLNITKSCSHKVQGMDWVTTPPKNKTSRRCVPIPKTLVDIINEHLYTRLNKLGSPALFLCGGLFHIPDSTLIALKDNVEKESGVPHIRVHDLRHSYVSVLINSGTPVTTISKLVGHSSTEITWKVYSHLYPDTLASAVTAFDNEVCGNSFSTDSHILGGIWGAGNKKGI